MSEHFCEFCQVVHTSNGCYHPGHRIVALKNAEIESLRAQLAEAERVKNGCIDIFKEYVDFESDFEEIKRRISELKP